MATSRRLGNANTTVQIPWSLKDEIDECRRKLTQKEQKVNYRTYESDKAVIRRLINKYKQLYKVKLTLGDFSQEEKAKALDILVKDLVPVKDPAIATIKVQS